MKSVEYVLIVNNASENILRGVDDAFKKLDSPELRGLLLTQDPQRYKDKVVLSRNISIEVVGCDFETDAAIAAALHPFRDNIRAVVCGGEKHVQYLRKVVPHLPPTVRVANAEALEIATNKRLMREAFMRHHPEITPQFIQVHDNSLATIRRLEATLQYPVIAKPANLASSLLVQSCHSRSELKEALTKIFNHIGPIYKREGRRGAPQVIVEEYLEGKFYSIDAYVMAPDEMYVCPPVGYIPAKQLGIDDFFLYKRFMPTELSEDEIAGANEAVRKAIQATGLMHSSAHVELVLTKNGWKIIELGPRLGRFRHLMYDVAYGINHSLNDVLIHFGIKPHISSRKLQHCAGYIIYPETEGVLYKITGIPELKDNPAVRLLHVFAKPGDSVLHAKHGGRAVAEFVVASPDLAIFQRTIAFIEENVKAVVARPVTTGHNRSV